MSNLKTAETGRKVGLIIHITKTAMELAHLSMADLEELRRYAERITTIGPIVAPTGYQQLPRGGEREVKRRVDVLLSVMKLQHHAPKDEFGPAYIRLVMKQLFARWNEVQEVRRDN